MYPCCSEGSNGPAFQVPFCWQRHQKDTWAVQSALLTFLSSILSFPWHRVGSCSRSLALLVERMLQAPAMGIGRQCFISGATLAAAAASGNVTMFVYLPHSIGVLFCKCCICDTPSLFTA